VRPPKVVERKWRPGAEDGSTRSPEAAEHARKLAMEKGGCVQCAAVEGGNVGQGSSSERRVVVKGGICGVGRSNMWSGPGTIKSGQVYASLFTMATIRSS
jgi:hypothetical protein